MAVVATVDFRLGDVGAGLMATCAVGVESGGKLYRSWRSDLSRSVLSMEKRVKFLLLSKPSQNL